MLCVLSISWDVEKTLNIAYASAILDWIAKFECCHFSFHCLHDRDAPPVSVLFTHIKQLFRWFMTAVPVIQFIRKFDCCFFLFVHKNKWMKKRRQFLLEHASSFFLSDRISVNSQPLYECVCVCVRCTHIWSVSTSTKKPPPLPHFYKWNIFFFYHDCVVFCFVVLLCSLKSEVM